MTSKNQYCNKTTSRFCHLEADIAKGRRTQHYCFAMVLPNTQAITMSMVYNKDLFFVRNSGQFASSIDKKQLDITGSKNCWHAYTDERHYGNWLPSAINTVASSVFLTFKSSMANLIRIQVSD